MSAAYDVILMDRESRGRVRNILVHMNKSGLTFVLEPASGEFLGVFSVPEVRNWITGVTEDGKLVGRNEDSGIARSGVPWQRRERTPEHGVW